MRSSLSITGFSLLAVLALMGCRKDSALSLDSEPLQLRTTEEDDRCPELKTFSFKYADETRSSVPDGHFLIGFSVKNDETQYPGVPLKTDMYDFREETGELLMLNDDPSFEALLGLLDVPTDTLNDYLEFTDLSRKSTGNELDSLLICLLASDINAMRGVVDIVDFNLYPLEVIDPNLLPNPNIRSNFLYLDPFASVAFDSRDVIGNLDIEEITGVDLDVPLSQKPIFKSNDEITPAEFEMKYDFSNGQLFVSAEWPTEQPLTRVSILAMENGPNAEVMQGDITDRTNGFPNGATLYFPELAAMIAGNQNEVSVLIAIEGFVADPSIPRTVNTLLLTFGRNKCRT